MARRLSRGLLIPLYLGAVLLLAGWQDRLSFTETPGQADHQHHQGVSRLGLLIPLYLGAVLLLAGWQDRLSFTETPGQADHQHHQGVSRLGLLIPLYLGAVLLLAGWQDRLSFTETPGQADHQHHQGVSRLGLLIPLYLGAVLLLAGWQDRLSFTETPGQADHQHHQGVIQRSLEPLVNLTGGREESGEEEGLLIVGNEQRHVGLNASALKATKSILVWTGGFGPEHLGGCPDWKCTMARRGSKVAEEAADAIVFHNGIGTPPKKRSPHQYYVFFTQESPLHSSTNVPYKPFYNLTMGYRRDADLPCPYGYAVKRLVPRTDAEMAEWEGTRLSGSKTKMVAWFSSNCHAPSGRDKYTAELKRHIPVDIYGACGPLQCPKSQRHECTRKLNDEYRFYLAFENSLCKDYVTEKYWEKAASFKVIPVVLKRSILERFAPPQSFLAADDFASPKGLAEEMKRIAADPTLFDAFFAWKRDYDVHFLDGQVHDVREQPWGFCRLCALLHEEPRPNIVQAQIDDFWRTQAHCERSETVDKLLGST